MIRDFSMVMERLFDTPVAIHPRKGEIVLSQLAHRFGISEIFRADGLPAPAAWFDDDDDDFMASGPSHDPGYDLVGGVAVIPVAGTLMQKRGGLRPESGATGYNGIRQSFLTALSDDKARAIAFDIKSGGGECAGLFDLVDTIYGARGAKPIAAILTEYAYSAAYVLASAADPGRVFVPRTGGTGSNGVIVMHTDVSEALGKAGLRVTFITSEGADLKTAGASELPLSEEAYAAIKADVDATAAILFETVARNRGLSVESVRGQRAATFMGAAGVTAGLADAVMAPDAAFAALLAEI